MTTLPYKAKALSPILPVADMQATTRFYAEFLGFSAAMQSDDYSILTREGVSLHLTRAHDKSVLEATSGHISIYLEVQNIDPLWAHVSEFKDRYKLRDLFDRDYGMREFHIVDPDGCLIFVGQEIETIEPHVA
jgi:catechol 2,3-dioxygenase-like lactoylglutathione lyase family enzyme